MAEDTDLCTLNNVLAYISIKDISSDKINDLIERLITAKTTAITRYIGYEQILAKDYTEYYNGDGDIRLYLNNTQINTVTEINIDTDWDFGSDTTVGSDDYRISSDKTYILLKDTIFTIGQENVKVTYNAGFATIPTDLAEVCIEEVVRAYNEKLNIGIVTRTDTKGSITRVEKGFMKQSVEVMDIYRRLVLI